MLSADNSVIKKVKDHCGVVVWFTLFWISMEYISCKVFCRIDVHKMSCQTGESLLSLTFIVKLHHIENSH